MRKLILLSALAVAGCGETPAEKAEKSFEAVKASGASHAEVCRSAQVVRDLYSGGNDQTKADSWEQTAQIECSLAYFKEGYRY